MVEFYFSLDNSPVTREREPSLPQKMILLLWVLKWQCITRLNWFKRQRSFELRQWFSHLLLWERTHRQSPDWWPFWLSTYFRWSNIRASTEYTFKLQSNQKWVRKAYWHFLLYTANAKFFFKKIVYSRWHKQLPCIPLCFLKARTWNII